MPLSDLVRAIPGVIVFGLLPGLALATCLAPRWSAWLRLAAAPGLSAGTLGVLGLLAHDAHVAFRPWWVGVVTAALLAGAARRLRRSGTRSPEPRRLAANVPQLVALACGVLLAATVAAGMRNEEVPIDADPAVHAAIAERIATHGDILPVIANPIDGSAAVRPRSGAEAVAAFAASAGAASPTQALLPTALLAILLAPLSLALLAVELTRNRAIATLAPILGAGFPYPALPTAFGEIPLIVDSTLVIPLAIAALRLVRSDAGRWQNAAMVVAAVASIWAIHGTEVLTAGVIVIPLALFALGELATRKQRVAWLKGAATAIAALAVGAIAVTVITRLPHVPPAAITPGGGAEVPESTTVGGGVRLVDFPRDFFDFVFPARIWLLAYVAGLVAAWKLRPHRGLLVAHLAFALILADVSTRRVLLSIYERVFPWSEPDRLASDQYWVLPILLAAGLVYVGTVLAPILARRLPALTQRRSQQAALVAAAVVAGIALGVGHDHDARFYANATASVGMVSSTDLDVMHRMAAQLTPDTPVMANGIDDAGQWVIALTPDLLYMSKDYVIAHPNDVRTQTIANACDDPDAARRALSGAGAIFVGSRERAGAKAHWSADCVARIPGLRLLAHNGNSAAFAVEPSPGALG